MNDQKTQIIEKLKSASNILVTVSMNPSVDQIAACIAMTLLLNKFKKNATAVFSGKVPSVLGFLKPNETLETTTDSLRDFIIALDKSKADKLRYKVEDDVVKIFITPYKTSITQEDLKYSAGDFNVDVIVALGVHHQQDLDAAILAHGRIFHDAVTVSMNNTPQGDLGVANWEDLEASSLSELVADLIEDLDPALLDAEVATALLTGIVAETGRFSNKNTHPRTLNVSSKLLEAGADQQLVNAQLQDLIGVVVNLEAGAEIKPTADTSNEPLHIDDTDGLNLGSDGVIGHLNDSQPEVAEQAEQATEAQQPEPAQDAAEAILGTAVEPTPAPVIEEPIEEEPIEPEAIPERAAEPATSDVDSARQAIDDALDHLDELPPEHPEVDAQAAAPAQPIEIQPPTADVSAEPEPAAAPEPISFPQQNPLISPTIQPIAANQPSYNNPATTRQFDLPTAPANEPAPLVMSPADQPFTMPMPPTSSMPSSQPPAFQPYPGQAINQPPAAGPVPPPLPPPMMPGQ